jgi:uncharacterized caspase-like protein
LKTIFFLTGIGKSESVIYYHVNVATLQVKMTGEPIIKFTSGAIAQGWRTKSVGVDLKKQLGAEGRVILTSSSATQTSFEQEILPLSLYTQYLVEGIETGAADTDNDGNIHVQELHAYAKAKVQAVKPKMTPEIILDKEGFNILLSYAPKNPEAGYRKLVEQYAQNGELNKLSYLHTIVFN